jgi:hypothetical protein
MEQGRDFAALVKKSVFKTFTGSGHYPHNEQPEAFAQVVRAFLDDPAVEPAELPAPAIPMSGGAASGLRKRLSRSGNG